MRYLSLIILLTCLSACSHKPVNEFAQETSVVVTQPASYAFKAPSGAVIKPTDPCAQGYDDVISHLEYLMRQRQTQQVAAVQTLQ